MPSYCGKGLRETPFGLVRMNESQQRDKNDEVSYSCDDETPCEQTLCETKRRRLLGAVAAGGSLSLAGCTSILAEPQESQVRGRDAQFDVNYLREGATLRLRGSETILEAGLAEGLDMNYICKAGYCGQCLSKADTDASEAVHMAINDVGNLTDEAVSDGYFLPCTSQPRANFSLQSNLDPGEELEAYDEDDDDDDVEEEDETSFVTYIHDGEPTVIDFEGGVDALIDDDRNMLVAGEEEDLDMDYQCREGFCGQCMAKVSGDGSELVEMTVNDYDPLDEEAVEDGWVLTCTGFPTDSFSMRTNAHDEFEDRE